MGKDTTKKAKLSKKARKAAARKRRMIRKAAIYGGIVIACIACMIILASANRPSRQQDSWYIRNSDIEIAAPASDLSGFRTMEQAEEDGNADARFAVPLPEVPSRASEAPTEQPTSTPTSEPTAGPTPLATPEPTAVTITITAAGDCTLGGSVHQDTYEDFQKVVKAQGYDYFFRNVRAVFAADDLTILNLEGVLTDVGKARRGMYCFKGDPENVQIMTCSSVELCNVANNHSVDFGRPGLQRTAEVLEQAGIGCCGYSKVWRGTVKGVRVTALGFDKWQNDTNGIVQAISQERPNCDLLIVNMHWGREKVYEPMSQQKEWGHAAIDAGADLVIGTHSHVYGGVELYKGKYIAYSLGNFCFGGNGNPSDKRCLMFQQTFVVETGGSVRDGGINIIPCTISSISNKNDFQPTVMQPKNGASLLKAIARYSNLNKDTLWMKNSYPEQIGAKVTAISNEAVRAVDLSRLLLQTTPVPAQQTATPQMEDIDDDALVGALDEHEEVYENSYTGTADADYAGDSGFDVTEDDEFGDLSDAVYDDADAESETSLISAAQLQQGLEVTDEQRKASEREAKEALYLDQMQRG